MNLNKIQERLYQNNNISIDTIAKLNETLSILSHNHAMVKNSKEDREGVEEPSMGKISDIYSTVETSINFSQEINRIVSTLHSVLFNYNPEDEVNDHAVSTNIGSGKSLLRG